MKKGKSVKRQKSIYEQTYGWTNSSRAKKCVPLDDNCVYQERKVQSWKNLYFLDRIPFLDLRSEGLSNLATLSEPRFARSDNRSALLDILSFFPTTSESESSLSEIKIRLRLYSFPGHTFGTMEEYIFHLKQQHFSVLKWK